MPHAKDDAAFCITIDYAKESESPARVFETMVDLIHSFEEIDVSLVACVDSKIKPILLLEDIEIGSLKAWLANRLRETDDGVIRNLEWQKVIGSYLVRAKYRMIDFLDGKTHISSKAEVVDLQKVLLAEAEQSKILQLPCYTPIDARMLLQGISRITQAIGKLQAGDSASFQTKEGEKANFNASFNFAPQQIEELITKNKLESVQTLILKVKKPDYLGSSMWEFRHNDRTVEAKILDEEWLLDFQTRKKDVRPGDALKARAKVEVVYGYDNSVIAEHYLIEKVIEVLPVLDMDNPSLGL